MQRSTSESLKGVFLLFGLFILPFLGQAQALIPFTLHWRKATLILANSDTLRGNASLTMPEDLIRLSQPDGNAAVFHPSEVQAFYVEEPYDAIPLRRSGDLLLQKRNYRPYLWNRDKDFSNYKAPALFVVVVPGKYTLLLREQKEQMGAGGATSLAGQALNEAMVNAQRAQNSYVGERFYLSVNGQEAQWLRKPKEDLLAHFPGKEKAIRNFAKQNRISFYRIEHLARIVAYCNTL